MACIISKHIATTLNGKTIAAPIEWTNIMYEKYIGIAKYLSRCSNREQFACVFTAFSKISYIFSINLVFVLYIIMRLLCAGREN